MNDHAGCHVKKHPVRCQKKISIVIHIYSVYELADGIWRGVFYIAPSVVFHFF